MDVLAEEGDPERFALPNPKVDGCPYDFSFSGLKTAVINLIHRMQQKGESLPAADIAASFRRAVVESLAGRAARAMQDTGAKKLVAAGGVSANRLLRRELEGLCREHGWEYFAPKLCWCGDNAAMVGSQGYYEWLAGHTAGMDLNACARLCLEAPEAL